MNFKKGDKVRVRQWEAMKRECGEISFCGIRTPIYHFTFEMGEYCGKVVTVNEVWNGYYRIREDDGAFKWTDAMFEGYAFEYGDVIEVSDDGIGWVKRIYVGYIDGALFPYMCVANGEENMFHSGKEFNTYYWKYARPVQKKHTIVIDGKRIQISEESYKKLKESLLR